MAGKFQKKRKSRKGGALRVWLLVALVLLTSGGIGTTVAKYITSKDGRILVRAPEFYFTSDLLTADGEAYYKLNSGTSQVNFTLSNSADSMRFSEVDIKYEVSVDNSALLKKNPEDVGQAKFSDQSIAKDSVLNTNYILCNLQPGVTYTVTAKGKAGYTQTLSAKFEVAGDDQNVYMNVTEQDGYQLLTVWTHNVEGVLNVTFPAGLVPDNTNPGMGTVYNKDAGGSPAFEIANFGKYSSQTYRFFGTPGADKFKVSVIKDGVTYPAAESVLS